MKKYLIPILLLVTQGCYNQKISGMNCLNKENFNLLKDYIITNGTQVKLEEKLVAPKGILSKEILFHDRLIELVDHSNHFEIIVIDKQDKVPVYSCSNENDELRISSYYSRFDNDEAISVRKNDWCEIIQALRQKG